MTTDGQKDFLTGHQGLGERTKADPEYNGRMTFANSGPKNLALSGEEKATTEPNGGPMLRPSPCSGPIQADYDYDYDYDYDLSFVLSKILTKIYFVLLKRQKIIFCIRNNSTFKPL